MLAKLNVVCSDGVTRPFWINVNSIKMLNEQFGATVLIFTDGSTLTVKETPQQAANLLNASTR
jgi:hypothetical protein